jgi:membrane protein DedA with SNARE-associated domain
MYIPSFLSHLIGGAVGSTLLLSFFIVIGTFILEDPTTIIVGVLAADGIISVPVAIFSLYAGIIVGDFGLYCLGWFASTHPRLRRYVDNGFMMPFRIWLESRFILTVFSARFIPGLRIPTFAACGFFRSPLSSFVLTAVAAASVWTTLLFSVSYWFGNITSEWIGPARWGVALAFIAALFFAGRHNILARKIKNIKAHDMPNTNC